MWIFALSFNHLFIENVFEVHNFITKWMEFIHSFLAAFYQSCCSRNGSFTLLFEVRVASWLDHEGKKNIFATHFPLDVVYIYKVFPIPLTIPVHSVTFHQYYKEQIYIERFIYFFFRPKGNFYFAFFQKLSILALIEVIFSRNSKIRPLSSKMLNTESLFQIMYWLWSVTGAFVISFLC